MDRRDFLRQTAVVGGVAALGAPRSARAAPSDTVVVGVMGVNGRGRVLANVIASQRGAEVAYICDVDERATARAVDDVRQRQSRGPGGVADFRRILDDDSIDALAIAAPDHWHAPAAILAMQAGKHVYVEKPLGHNPREGELVLEAQRRSGRAALMGNQQRSAPRSMRIVSEIHAGLIGRPYFARAWYANTRGSIGRGRPAPPPAWLDYDLWQGPAPRTPYRDNVVHYNWHWFWRWGTGEICNNGTHEIDVARWALQVGYPERVTSSGGRYHFNDDWEMYDTQIVSYDFPGGKSITWEGRSCNGRPIENRSRGVSIHGEDGTVILDRNGYVVYDNDNREVMRDVRGETVDALDTRGGGDMTDLHIRRFLGAVTSDSPDAMAIADGHISVVLCHLGNIAQRTTGALDVSTKNGHIVGEALMSRYWSRTYEPGWEPNV